MTLLPAHPKPPILLLGLAWAHPVLAADSTGTATYVAAVLAAIALAATVVAVLAVARARAPRPALEPPAAPEANLAEALEELDSLRRAQALEQTRLQAMQLMLDGAPLASVLDSAAAFLESLDDDLLCVILLIDPATAAVRVGSAPRATATLIDALEGRSADTPAEPHPAGERLTLTDLQSHPYWRSIAGHLGDSGLSACHCEPVMDRAGEVLGALDVYSPVPDAPDADQRDWIRQTAGLVAIALQHERDHAARRAAEEQAQLLLISANEGIFGLDLDGVTTFINPTGARMLGYEPGELVGRPNHDLIHHSSAEGTPIPASECRMLEVTRSGDDILVSDEMFWRRDGSRFPVEYRATPIRRRGPIIGAVVVFHDITRRRRREQLIHQLAYYDNQTGLPNRSLFKRRLVQRLRSARRDQGPFAVHLLDLDGFKAVNDSLGHPFGDRLLQKTAKRLKTLVRESDLVARLGGDEFAVIQPDARTREDAALLAAKMVSRLALPYRIDAHEVHCSASLGVVMVQDPDSDPDTLLARADVALYKAKGNGRGSYAFHTDAMTRKAHRDAALAQRLDQAVRDGELFLHYQPQVEMATGRIVALEALVRWRHPQEGVLPAQGLHPPRRAERSIPGARGLGHHHRRAPGTRLDGPGSSVRAHRHQCLPPADPRRQPGGRCHRRGGRYRPPPGSDRARVERGGIDRVRRAVPAPDRAPTRGRNPGVHRRLRGRGVLTHPAAPLGGPRHQDRSGVRPRDRRQRCGVERGAGLDRADRIPRRGCHRGGRRDRPPGTPTERSGMPLRPGQTLGATLDDRVTETTFRGWYDGRQG